MIKEIYIRDEKDPYFEPGIIDYSNEMENIVSQIKMILGTRKGQVLGEYDFGVDLEYMVFTSRASAGEVQKQINEQISKYVVHSNNIIITTKVNFGDSGLGYDYAIIDIYINGGKAIGFLIDKE